MKDDTGKDNLKQTFCRELEGLRYRGVLLSHALATTVVILFRKEYRVNAAATWPAGEGAILYWLDKAGSLARYLGGKALRRVFTPLRQGKRRKVFRQEPCLDDRLSGKKIFFIMDLDLPYARRMQEEVMKEFDPLSVVVISRNIETCDRMGTDYETFCPNGRTRSLTRQLPLQLLVMGRVLHRSMLVRSQGLSFKLAFLRQLLHALQLVDFYEGFLDPEIHDAVVTLFDADCHSSIIVQCANRKGIKTFTLQHGTVGEWYTPVVADRIFLWGRSARKRLLNLSVPETKLVISGRPGHAKAMRHAKARRESLRREFFEKFSFGQEKVVIAFFPERFGPEEDRLLFSFFLDVLDLDFLPVVKFRPGTKPEEAERYREWARSSWGEVREKKIRFLQNDNLYEMLCVTDILITCGSTVAVEGLALSVVCVLLDIFDQVSLQDHLFEYRNFREAAPHYEDCSVVKSKAQLRSLISRFLEDPGALSRERKASARSAGKFFHLPPQGSSEAKLIWEYVRGFHKDL